MSLDVAKSGSVTYFAVVSMPGLLFFPGGSMTAEAVPITDYSRHIELVAQGKSIV
jgi:hypothetical protein